MKASRARSGCPIALALDVLGDKWTLLVLRDLALKGKHTFAEMKQSEEGIATNILADRLDRLVEHGLVRKQRDPQDGRRFQYSLKEAGRDLLPVLVELIVWSSKHDERSEAPEDFVRRAKSDRRRLLAELRRGTTRPRERW